MAPVPPVIPDDHAADGLHLNAHAPPGGVMTVTGRLADAAAGARYVRFAVCKRDEVLLEACERLARLR